jgi:hypothetical protein
MPTGAAPTEPHTHSGQSRHSALFLKPNPKTATGVIYHMEMTWDLSVFYKGFDDPQLESDIQRIAQLSHSAAAIAAESS